jgi:AP-1 complex subunit mu
VFELEDIKFHSCVRLSQFERDRSIAFVPPDGEFNLMRYRPSAASKPIIRLDSTIERNERSRVEMLIRARAHYRPQSVAQNVTIHIPVPSDVGTPKAQCTAGRMQSSPNDSALVWTIKPFPGRKRFTLRAHFGPRPSKAMRTSRSGRSLSHSRFHSLRCPLLRVPVVST